MDTYPQVYPPLWVYLPCGIPTLWVYLSPIYLPLCRHLTPWVYPSPQIPNPCIPAPHIPTPPIYLLTHIPTAPIYLLSHIPTTYSLPGTRDTYYHPHGQTNTCENITFPHLYWRVAINWGVQGRPAPCECRYQISDYQFPIRGRFLMQCKTGFRLFFP